MQQTVHTYIKEILNDEPFLKKWQWGTTHVKVGINQNNTKKCEILGLHGREAEVFVLEGDDIVSLGNMLLVILRRCTTPIFKDQKVQQ
jgi:hypothetical protein